MATEWAGVAWGQASAPARVSGSVLAMEWGMAQSLALPWSVPIRPPSYYLHHPAYAQFLCPRWCHSLAHRQLCRRDRGDEFCPAEICERWSLPPQRPRTRPVPSSYPLAAGMVYRRRRLRCPGTIGSRPLAKNLYCKARPIPVNRCSAIENHRRNLGQDRG